MNMITESSNMYSYPDDTTISVSDKDVSLISEKLTDDCRLVDQWCQSNHLFLNEDKIHSLLVCTPQRRLFLDVSVFKPTMSNGKNIEPSKHQKLLGVMVDENLTWNPHIKGCEEFEGVTKSLCKKINYLRKLSSYTQTDVLLQIANGIFIPTLIYAMPLWGGTSAANINKLQILQNKALRIIFKANIYTPMQQLRSTSGWLNVNSMIKYHSSILLHKVINLGQPRYIFNKISWNNSLNVSTRHTTNQTIHLKLCRLSLSQNAFIYRTCKLWNEIPLNIRTISNISTFKKTLKIFLSNQ